MKESEAQIDQMPVDGVSTRTLTISPLSSVSACIECVLAHFELLATDVWIYFECDFPGFVF